ncbi:MBL fold metallo-hydrolase [Vibrio lentus]|nr:MBL fold metallo-hydrolase [Vibrio lentus]
MNELDHIFITHLHVDHYGSLPYLYQFGGWNGRWEKAA